MEQCKEIVKWEKCILGVNLEFVRHEDKSFECRMWYRRTSKAKYQIPKRVGVIIDVIKTRTDR